MPNIIFNHTTIQIPLMIFLMVLAIGCALYFGFLYYRNKKNHQKDISLLFQKHKEIVEKEEEIKAQADNLLKQKQEISKQGIAVGQQSTKLKAAYRKLKELDRFKEALTDMIVHDLKNPLNTIINLSEKDSNIERAGKKMLNMVHSILDIRKFEEAEIYLDTESVNLSQFTEQAIEEVTYLLHEKSIDLKVKVQENLYIKADLDILLRVIVNLLTNAIKHTPNNGLITLESEYHSKDSKICYKVIDTGEGISKKDIKKIFTKFGQVKARKSGKIRSTGLGLTFSKMAIEAHQGTIGVETVLGKGSTFWFKLVGYEDAKQDVKANGIAPKHHDNSLTFQEDEKIFLKDYYPQIQKLDVYEYSEMQKILQDITEKKTSKNIEKWKKEMENALISCNELKYEYLVSQLR